MVKVPRDRAKEVLLLDPGKWVGGRDGSGGEDGVVVAVEVDRVSNRVAGAVWIHQEHLYHLCRWKGKFRLEDSESELPKLGESWYEVKFNDGEIFLWKWKLD